MATFEAQVEGLTSLSIDGSSAPTLTELTQFLTDGAKEVINILPSNLLDLCASSVSFTSGSASTLNTGKVLRVFRSDGDITQPCRVINSMNKGRYGDSEDMNYATVTDPVFYIENNSLDVLPVGGSATYSEVQYPAVTYGLSAITAFPDEAEYLVALYASIRSLQNVLGDKSSNSSITTALSAITTEMDETQAVCDKIDADLVLAKAEVVFAQAEAVELATQTDNSSTFNTALAAIASELGKADEIIVQASEEFDEVATQVSGTATSAITSARSAVPTVLSIDDLNINAVLPSAPSISTVAYSDASNADASASAVTAATASEMLTINVSASSPAYTKPTITSRVAFSAYTSGLSETDPGVLSITAVSPLSLSLTSITFSSVDSDVDAFLPTYTTATVSAGGVYGGNTPPTYTKPSTAPSFGHVASYIDDEEDVELASAKLQQVNAELNEYQVNIQNEQNEFNKENIAYQANIQEAMQELQVANQRNIAAAQGELQLNVDNENRSQERQLHTAINDMKVIFDNNDQAIRKYQAELSVYQANVGKEVQSYTQNLTRYSTELNIAYTAWAKTESDSLQQYQSDIQNELNEFNKDNVAHQMDFQEAVTKENHDLQIAIANANNLAQEYRQEAQQSTEMDKFNKAQDQALNLENAAKQIEDLIADNNSKLQKYSSELQSYQAQINKDIQEYQANLQQKTEEFDSSRKLQQSYLEEAQAGIAAGNAYIQEAQAVIAQAGGYASEVSARAGFSSAKLQAVQGHISTAQTYVATAQGFGNEVQAKIAIAQGYGNEVQARLAVDTSHYGWYEKQQAKLQQDYDRGLQFLIGGGLALQQQ